MDFIKKYKRKIIQFSCAIFYNLHFVGFINESLYKGKIKQICIPGLNCYSCPAAIASCPIGAMQQYMSQHPYKSFFLNKIPIYVIGIIVLFGVLCGRLICGFLCPFGLLQELLFKIKTKKIRKSETTRKYTMLKYFILIICVVVIPVIFLAPGFCKYICPQGTLEAGIYFAITNKDIQALLGKLFCLKIFILIIVITLSIFMYRFFCRFICPLGAIYSLFNKIAIFGIKIDENKCTHCNKCINLCLMDVKQVGDRECIECGECIKNCSENAIVFK